MRDSLCEMCVFCCVPGTPGKPRGAQGIRAQRPCDQAFRDWLSADVTSVSLPLPSSSSSHSPSLSLPVILCLALCCSAPFPSSPSPSPFLSIPPAGDGVCRGCSSKQGLRGEDSPFLRHHPPVFCLFFGCLFAVSCSSTAAAASRLSPHPASLCGCLGAGPSGVGGGGNEEHASPGSCIELAMPCPGILRPAGSL